VQRTSVETGRLQMQDLWFCELELCEDLHSPLDLEEFGRLCWRGCYDVQPSHGIIYHALSKPLRTPLDNVAVYIYPLRLLPLQELASSLPRPA
jgi:hypothetical protein